jgi:hypothetical protein
VGILETSTPIRLCNDNEAGQGLGVKLLCECVANERSKRCLDPAKRPRRRQSHCATDMPRRTEQTARPRTAGRAAPINAAVAKLVDALDLEPSGGQPRKQPRVGATPIRRTILYSLPDVVIVPKTLAYASGDSRHGALAVICLAVIVPEFEFVEV